MTGTSPRNPRPNPYVGPRAFESGEVIYGRDVETRKLVNLLIAERIILLYAPSGAGKTSLLQAALIPQLQIRKRDLHIWPVIRISHELTAPMTAAPIAGPERGAPSEGSSDSDSEQTGEPSQPGAYNRRFTANRYIFSLVSSLESARGSGSPDAGSGEDQAEALLSDGSPRTASALAQISLADYLAQRPRPEGKKFELFIFDQFEEILTLDPTDQPAKEAFFSQLGEALDFPTRWAVFSMREDFVAALDPYLYLLPTRLSNTFRLDLLGEAAARQAIQAPTRAQAVVFDDKAAQQLVDDLRKVKVMQLDGATREQLGPYVEPVQLQVVCHRLWESLSPDDMLIDVEDIRAVGDVGQALADYYARRVKEIAGQLANEVRSGLNEGIIRRWVENELITEQGLRSQVLMSALKSKGLDNRAIARLENVHLVRAEKRGGAIWFELAHDRLVEPVRQNNLAWFEVNLSLLQRQAALWDRQNHPDHLLLRDAALAEAEAWAEQPANETTRIEEAFLKACRAMRAQMLHEKENIKLAEQARSAGKLRRRAYALSVALAATAIITIIALILGNAAYRYAGSAEAQEAIANAASTQAVAQKATAEAYSLQADQQRATAQAASTQAVSERAQAQQAAIDEAQQRLAAESASEKARLAQLEAESQSRLAEMQRDLAITRGIASQSQGLIDSQPDLALLLAMEAEAITDTAEARSALFAGLSANDHFLASLHGSAGLVSDLAFSSDGRALAAASENEVVLWDLTDRLEISQVLTGPAGILDIAFSPDGRALAAGSRTGEVAIWSIYTGSLELRLGSESYKYYDDYYGNHSSLAFSPDNQHIAFTNGQDYQISVWRISDSTPMTLTDYNGWITSLAFSPDGKVLAAGNTIGQILLWDLAHGQLLAPPLSDNERITSLTFLKFIDFGSELYLFAGAQDGVFTYWDYQTLTSDGNTTSFPAHNSVDAIFSDSSSFVFGLENGEVILTDLYNYSLINLPGHRAPVNSVALSPDGTLLASTGADGSVFLWRKETIPLYTQPITQTGSLAGLTLVDGRIAQTSLAALSRFAAMRGDGPVLVAGYSDRVEFFDMVSGASVIEAVYPATTTVQLPIIPQSIAFSPDGNVMASGGDDGSVQFWNTRQVTATALSSATTGHQAYVYRLLFSPDARRLASMASDFTIRLWDVDSLSPISPALKMADYAWSAAFIPDGNRLVSGQSNGQLLLWDLSPSSPISVVLAGQSSGVNALAYNPRGKLLVSGGCRKFDDSGYCTQGEISLWELSNPDAPARLIKSFPAHNGWVTGFTFSPDGQYLASSGWDNTVLMWQVADPGAASQVGPPLAGYANPVAGMAFSPDGHQLTTVSNTDANVLTWDLDKRTVIKSFRANTTPENSVYPVTLSANNARLATIDINGRIRLWDLDTQAPGKLFVGRKSQEALQFIASLAIAPSAASPGVVLALGSQDGVISLVDIQTRQPLTSPLALFTNPVVQLTISPDGQWLVAADDTGEIKTLQLDALQLVEDIFPEGQTARSAVFSPVDNLLALAPMESSKLEIWDLSATPAISTALSGHQAPIGVLAFSQDGKWLASADIYGTILIHSVGLRQVKKRLYQPDGSFTSLAFSADGKFLAAGSYWGKISLWDLNSGKRIATFQVNNDSLTSLLFHPNGKYLISGGESNGQVQFWQVDLADWQARACTIADRNLSWSEWQQYLGDGGRPYRVTCPGNEVNYQDIAGGYLQQARMDLQAGELTLAEQAIEFALAWGAMAPDEAALRTMCFASNLETFQNSLDTACILAAARLETPLLRIEYYLQAQKQALAAEALQQASDEAGALALAADRFEAAATLCMAEGIPSDLKSMLTPACLQAAELAGDDLTRMFYYHQAGDLEQAAAALQNAVDEVLAIGTFEAASTLCLAYAVPPEIQSLLTPACRRAAETAPDEFSQIYYYDLAGESSQLSTLLPDFISATLHLSDTYYLSELCLIGVRNGLTEAVRPACLFMAEAAYSLLERGQYYALGGYVIEAEQAIAQAAQEALDFESGWDNNSVCWFGSIVGFARTVLPNCELAVELSDGDSMYRDSRGLAYALIGFEELDLGHGTEAQEYFEKAILDFKAYADSSTYDGTPSAFAQERLSWIEAILAGVNPFDIQTLLGLLQQ